MAIEMSATRNDICRTICRGVTDKNWIYERHATGCGGTVTLKVCRVCLRSSTGELPCYECTSKKWLDSPIPAGIYALTVRVDGGYEVVLPGWGAVGERIVDGAIQYDSEGVCGESPPTNYSAVELAAQDAFCGRSSETTTPRARRNPLAPGTYLDHPIAMYVAAFARQPFATWRHVAAMPASIVRALGKRSG